MDQDWLEQRRRGLGGSDAPAVCGISPWKSPYQVYLEKRGETEPQEDNEPMFWGRALEPIIRQRYADETGRTVVVPQQSLFHPKIEFMLASLDGIADGERVLEVKTARMPTGWGEAGSAEIPDIYMIQVQHYLAVTKLSVADVATLIGGNDFRIYEVPADTELQDLIIEKETAFWKMVQDGTPPDPVSFADLKQRFGSMSKAIRVQADQDVLAAIHRLKQIKELIKEEELMKAIIMAALKEADTLIDGESVLATWKAGKGATRFDQKEFQNSNPKLYAQFLKESDPVRRLLIK